MTEPFIFRFDILCYFLKKNLFWTFEFVDFVMNYWTKCFDFICVQFLVQLNQEMQGN